MRKFSQSTKNEDFLTIGGRLRAERKRVGATQACLAENVSVALRTIIDWELGRTSPTANQLMEAQKIGIDAGFVLTGARTAPPSRCIDAKLMGLVLEGVKSVYAAENARLSDRTAGELAARLYDAILVDCDSTDQSAALRRALDQLRLNLRATDSNTRAKRPA